MDHIGERQGAVVVSLRIASFALNVLLGAILMVGSAFWSWSYWSNASRAPTAYLSTVILNNIAVPGENLIGQVTLNKRKNCPGVVERFIVRLLDDNGREEIVARDQVQAVTTDIAEGINVIFRMPVPKDAVAGNYVFRSNARFDCSGRIFTLMIPSSPFRVGP